MFYAFREHIFVTFSVFFSQIASIFTFSFDIFFTLSYLFTYKGIFTFEGATVDAWWKMNCYFYDDK